MWLRNYYNFLTAALLGDTTDTSTDAPTTYDPPIRVQRMNGNYETVAIEEGAGSTVLGGLYRQVASIGKNIAILMTGTGSQYCGYTGICVGTGSTAVTYDDYTLDSMITSGLTLVSPTGTLTNASSYDSDNNHYSSTRSFTLNNSSANAIAISEVGLCLFNASGAGTVSGAAVLVYREVLSSPVTLNPSESVIIAITRDAEVYNYTSY